MSETVRLNIVEVGAQQAAKNTKSLKQQIRDLRNELVTLDSSTEEYNTKLLELSDLLHKNEVITEQAKFATSDLGRTYSNLTTISNGVIGSFQAINGVMNSIGLANTEAEESIKQMMSLMSIVQGLSNLDAAEKAFKGFLRRVNLTTTGVKANTQSLKDNAVAASTDAKALTTTTTATKAQGVAATTATKGVNLLSVGFKKLGAAIKAFVIANPLLTILAVVTSIVTVVSSLLDKTKEETEEISNWTYGLQQAKKNVPSELSGTTSTAGNVETARKATDDIKETYSTLQHLEEDYADAVAQHQKERQELIIKGYKEDSKEIQNIDRQMFKTQEDMYKFQFKAREQQIAEIEKNLKGIEEQIARTTDKARKDELKADAEQAAENINTATKEMEEAANNYVKAVGDTNALLEKKRQQRTEKLNEQMNNDKKLIENEAEMRKLFLKRQFDDNTISEVEYYDNLAKIEENYLNAYKQWASKYKQAQDETALASARIENQVTENLKKSKEEQLKIQQFDTDPSREQARMRALREQQAAMGNLDITRQDNERILRETEALEEETMEIREAYWLKKMALLMAHDQKEVEEERKKQNELLHIQLERQNASIDALHDQYQFDRNAEMETYQYELQKIQDDISLSNEQRRQKEILLESEHLNKLKELETDYINAYAEAEASKVDIEAQIQDNLFQMEKDFFERRLELQETFINAFSTLSGSISSVLSEAQQSYDEGSKAYQSIAESMIIIDTISGAMSAFVSGVRSIPFAPANLIYGGVLSGLVVAQGLLQLNNLKSKNISKASTSAAISVNPYETLSYQTNSDILGSISDSRCYVLESDITQTQNRVAVAEQEATF